MLRRDINTHMQKLAPEYGHINPGTINFHLDHAYVGGQNLGETIYNAESRKALFIFIIIFYVHTFFKYFYTFSKNKFQEKR